MMYLQRRKSHTPQAFRKEINIIHQNIKVQAGDENDCCDSCSAALVLISEYSTHVTQLQITLAVPRNGPHDLRMVSSASYISLAEDSWCCS